MGRGTESCETLSKRNDRTPSEGTESRRAGRLPRRAGSVSASSSALGSRLPRLRPSCPGPGPSRAVCARGRGRRGQGRLHAGLGEVVTWGPTAVPRARRAWAEGRAGEGIRTLSLELLPTPSHPAPLPSPPLSPRFWARTTWLQRMPLPTPVPPRPGPAAQARRRQKVGGQSVEGEG